MMTATLFSLVLCCVFLNAGGQLLLKAGMDEIGEFSIGWHNVLPIAVQAASNWWVIAGLVCSVLSLVVWLIVISRVEISLAYPLVSLGYVVNLIAAYYLLHENVNLARVMGIFVIIFGVYLVGRS